MCSEGDDGLFTSAVVKAHMFLASLERIKRIPAISSDEDWLKELRISA